MLSSFLSVVLYNDFFPLFLCSFLAFIFYFFFLIISLSFSCSSFISLFPFSSLCSFLFLSFFRFFLICIIFLSSPCSFSCSSFSLHIFSHSFFSFSSCFLLFTMPLSFFLFLIRIKKKKTHYVPV